MGRQPGAAATIKMINLMRSAVVSAEGRFIRCSQIPEQGTQAMQLVKQVQDDGNALVVHSEVNDEILDQ